MYTLNIPKMSCGGCVNSIKAALMKLDNEALINVDLPAKQVTITTDQPVEAIKSTLANVGYPISEVN